MLDEQETTAALHVRAAAGDGVAWGTLLTAYQERLARMVAFRMDDRLRGRIDATDIVQEAFVPSEVCHPTHSHLATFQRSMIGTHKVNR